MRKTKTLTDLRADIDSLDERIIKALAKRQHLANRIGQLKATANLQITNKKREWRLMQRYKKLSKIHRLRAVYVTALFKRIIAESKRVQKS